MRAAWSYTAKFPIVVAIVAIRAEDLCSHAAALRDAIEIQHVRRQAGLRQGTATDMGNRMARCAGISELRDDVEKVSGCDSTRGKITKNRIRDFAGAGTVATQAILVLIDGRIYGRHAIGSVDSGNTVLRSACQRRRRKGGHLIGRVAIVAIRASRVAIAVKDQTFGGVMGIRSGREGMADFCEFGENVRDPG